MGTAIGYVIMFAVLALVAFLLFSPGVGMNTQFANLVENVPVYVQGISDWANDMYARYAYMLEDESVRAFVTDVQASAMEWAGDFAKNSASGRHRVRARGSPTRLWPSASPSWSPSGSSCSCLSSGANASALWATRTPRTSRCSISRLRA